MGRLQNLKEDWQEKQLRDIAKWIVKYQNFKLNIALEKIDTDFCSKLTLKNYLVRGLRYLKTGKKTSGVKTALYDFLEEELEKHTQPLRPTFSEQKQAYRRDYTKKENIPPIVPVTLKKVQKPLIANFEYGIRIENDIKIFKNEDMANGFLQGLNFCGNNEGRLVSVEVENL